MRKFKSLIAHQKETHSFEWVFIYSRIILKGELSNDFISLKKFEIRTKNPTEKPLKRVIF